MDAAVEDATVAPAGFFARALVLFKDEETDRRGPTSAQ
jgi:hypothetical protein